MTKIDRLRKERDAARQQAQCAEGDLALVIAVVFVLVLAML